MSSFSSSVDWATWQPQIRATLLFLTRNECEVLLIRKKRGIGAGKINGPGGKLEPGETPEECAIRETMEEVGLRARNPKHHGQLQFQFIDGLSILCDLFVADEHTGEMVETDEAIPFWVKISEIPYHEMWEDDRHWLPVVLAEGATTHARFLFDGEKILEMQIKFDR